MHNPSTLPDPVADLDVRSFARSINVASATTNLEGQEYTRSSGRVAEAEKKAAAEIRTFPVGNFQARDGQNNVVGSVSNLQVVASPTQTGSRVFVSYGFYNGSGTWRGAQNIILTFRGKDKGALAQLTVPIDRGKCVYDEAEARSFDGAINVKAANLNSVEAMVTKVSGTQTKC